MSSSAILCSTFSKCLATSVQLAPFSRYAATSSLSTISGSPPHVSAKKGHGWQLVPRKVALSQLLPTAVSFLQLRLPFHSFGRNPSGPILLTARRAARALRTHLAHHRIL